MGIRKIDRYEKENKGRKLKGNERMTRIGSGRYIRSGGQLVMTKG